MNPLPAFLATQWAISTKAHGHSRPVTAPTADLRAALQRAEAAQDLYGWVDVVMAALEASLRCGASSFAVAQALVNRQAELGARRWPPVLAQPAEPAKRQPETH